MIRYLSLFSGIEAPTVAWGKAPLNWEAVAFAEIDKYCNQLLSHYYPSVLNLGDITKITEEQIKDLGQIDLVIFGSPCQSLSLANSEQNGFDGVSGLFFEGMRIVDYARRNNGCRYALWENVTGAFSANKGRDFARVVETMAGVRFNPEQKEFKWKNAGFALGEKGLLEWRVLDSQYFGAAQKRRRLFALADFGDWRNRPPILIDTKSCIGSTKKDKGEESKSTTSPDRDSFCYNLTGDPTPKISDNCANTLRANAGGGITPSAVVYGFSLRRSATVCEESVPTLLATDYKSGGHAVLTKGIARKLMPIETERLMGFPDNYTNVCGLSNTQRYKMLGNSIVVNVLRWIGERIEYSLSHQLMEQIDMSNLQMMPQSPSSLQTFLTCPRQYFAKYISKEVEFTGNKHTIFGSKVHKVFEDYLSSSGQGQQTLPDFLLPAKKYLDKMKKSSTCLAEVKLAIDKSNNLVDWFDKSAYQRCIIDALLVNKDESIVLCIDWKTGKKRDNQTQHDFIKKCAGAKYPNATIYTLFIYLFAGQSTLQVFKHDPLTELDNSMKQLEQAYELGIFPPKTSGLCKGWCDVLSCAFNVKHRN